MVLCSGMGVPVESGELAVRLSSPVVFQVMLNRRCFGEWFSDLAWTPNRAGEGSHRKQFRPSASPVGAVDLENGSLSPLDCSWQPVVSVEGSNGTSPVP
jgi:hypothetical protein